jgi:hypothetical protein
MFQVYARNILSVSYVCLKFRSDCNGYLHMFAMATNMFSSFFLVFCKCFRHMLSVSAVSNVCYKCVHLDVAKINRVLHML